MLDTSKERVTTILRSLYIIYIRLLQRVVSLSR